MSHAKSKPKRKVNPRFDALEPTNYMNLKALWHHRENLRKNLLRAQEKAKKEAPDHRSHKDVERIQRHLVQLDENKDHVYEHVKLYMEMVLLESRLPHDNDVRHSLQTLTRLFGRSLLGAAWDAD